MLSRDMTRDIAKVMDDDVDWTNYRTKRNFCIKLQKLDRQKFYREMFDRLEKENDASKIYSTAKDLLGWTKAGPPSCFQLAGRQIFKQKELTEAQAQYYVDKVEGIKKFLPRVNEDPLKYLRRAFNRWRPDGGKPMFVLKNTNTNEVMEMIKKLKNGHAYGIDEIDSFTVKLAGPVIAPLIAHIINLSLESGKFPSRWKMARILPLQKRKDCGRLKSKVISSCSAPASHF